MEKSFPDLQKILNDLTSMEKELDKVQGEMTKNLALRVSVMQKIAELVKNEEGKIVLEKTKRTKSKRKKKPVKKPTNK
jgi:ABC-type uncharacterized transport system ATPase subunit